ncbi:MAG: FAD-binding oxidoreductase [Syntrophomonadales bacterium]
MKGLSLDLGLLMDKNRVRTDPEDLLAYTNDATHYFKRSMPDAVVLPNSTEEVSRVMKYASKHQIPVTPRGAGSGLSGACTPVHGGIVMDMKRMNQILEIDPRNMTATVEAGLVLSKFHRTVEKMGLFYPPDPQSLSVCTLGGNVATRAGGPRGVKYGTTGNYVLGMEIVLPDGSVINSGGKFVKQSVGYDITHLMTGSEGTLGVITRINVRLIALPPEHKTIVVTCESPEQAAEMVAEIIARGTVPAMLEYLSQGAVGIMNNIISPPLAGDAEAYLLIEVDGNRSQVDYDTAVITDLCKEMKPREVRVIEDEREAASYWRARSNLYPLMLTILERVISEDLTVPRSMLPEMVRMVQEVSASTGVGIGLGGHAGDGNIHPTILHFQTSPELDEKSQIAIGELLKKGLELGGTISGEHGIGIHKSEFLAWELGEVQIELMKRIKQAFDPLNIMNPGKIWPEGGECRC